MPFGLMNFRPDQMAKRMGMMTNPGQMAQRFGLMAGQGGQPSGGMPGLGSTNPAQFANMQTNPAKMAGQMYSGMYGRMAALGR